MRPLWKDLVIGYGLTIAGTAIIGAAALIIVAIGYAIT
jgi:hypothetical protein